MWLLEVEALKWKELYSEFRSKRKCEPCTMTLTYVVNVTVMYSIMQSVGT